jgi:hypothetical protein
MAIIGEDGRYEVEAAIPVKRPEVMPMAQPDAPPAGLQAAADPAEAGVAETGTEANPAGPAPASRVRAGHSPAGRAVRVVHRGPYERMGPTYEKLAAWIAAHAMEEGRVSWEQYMSDPGETPEDELITHIYFRIGDGS